MLVSISGTSYANCADFEAEAEAIEGAVPRFNEDGSLRSISMYADASFLVPKRSLISKARTKAELKAKRAFSSWMEESLESETVAADMMEQEQVTDEQGNTQGKVVELETQLNVMRQSTSAVLSGLIKLDECVDKEGKFLIVQLGWKPSLSKAAADTKQTIKKEVSRGNAPIEQDAEASNNSTTPTSKITEAEGYRKKSSIKDDF